MGVLDGAGVGVGVGLVELHGGLVHPPVGGSHLQVFVFQVQPVPGLVERSGGVLIVQPPPPLFPVPTLKLTDDWPVGFWGWAPGTAVPEQVSVYA